MAVHALLVGPLAAGKAAIAELAADTDRESGARWCIGRLTAIATRVLDISPRALSRRCIDRRSAAGPSRMGRQTPMHVPVAATARHSGDPFHAHPAAIRAIGLRNVPIVAIRVSATLAGHSRTAFHRQSAGLPLMTVRSAQDCSVHRFASPVQRISVEGALRGLPASSRASRASIRLGADTGRRASTRRK